MTSFVKNTPNRRSRALRTAACFLIAAITLLCSLPCAHASARRVRVGYYLLDGYQEQAADGSLFGYSYEYYMRIAQHAGWDCEFITADLEQCMQMLADGDIDIVSGLDVTAERMNYLDYSDQPCSTDGSELYALDSNKALSYDNFSAFDGMTVAIMNGNAQEDLLDSYCEDHGISIKKLYVSSAAALIEALENNSADAAFTSGISNASGKKIIARFERLPLYFGVSKKSTGLLSELNTAITRIDALDPDFREELYDKYLAASQTARTALSDEELSYVKERGTVYVLVEKDWAPIIMKDSATGCYRGIAVDILSRISDISGLQFVYTGDPRQCAGDTIKVVNTDFNTAAATGSALTTALLNAPVVLVAKDADLDPEDMSIVLESNNPTSDAIAADRSAAAYAATAQECLNMVMDGSVDAAYMNAYTASYYLSKTGYTSLYVVSQKSYGESISISIPSGTPEELTGILNKSLRSITCMETDAIAISVNGSDDPVTLESYFASNPFEAYILFSVILIVIIALLSVLVIAGVRSRRKLSRALLAANVMGERYKVALRQVSCSILEYDFSQHTLQFSETAIDTPAVIALSDTDSLMMLGRGRATYPDMPAVFEHLEKCALAGETAFTETVCGTDGGEERWARLTFSIVYDSAKPIMAIGTMTDVSSEKNADLDPLTQLLNRASFQRSVSAQSSDGDISAFLMLDMDGFKAINDTYGHAVGDRALITVGSALKRAFRKSDLVARIGGDEFAVFMHSVSDEEFAVRKAQHTLRQLSRIRIPLEDGGELCVSLSMGLSFAPRHGSDFASLYQKSDIAMYRSKQSGRGRMSVFTEPDTHERP